MMEMTLRLELQQIPPEFGEDFAAPIDRFTDAILGILGQGPVACEAESPESHKGAADGEPCYRAGVVFDLRDERLKCLRCFEER